jgi:cytoskeleton protein RodZ
MNDEVDKQDETAEEAAAGPVGGERLAAARREQQIPVLEIAKELHLDEYKVRALENNEFDVLGAPVFAKGHLKKYAQLVGTNAGDVMADYYRLTRSAEVPPFVSERPRPRKELTPGPWIAVVVVIVIAVSAYWWLMRPPEPVPATAPAQQESLPDESEPESGAPAVVDGADEADESTGSASADSPAIMLPDPVPEETAVQAEETSSPEIAEGQVRVLLTYTGDCWTEITDASGRRLLFDLGRDGRSVELSGAEPFNVLFGSPGNVTVRVNGEDFALPPSRPDRPLRLSISGT